jgi:hypothetical protein
MSDANRLEGLALRVLVDDPIDKGNAEIDVLAGTGDGHVRLPATRQELLHRGVCNLERQDRAHIDVATDVLLGGEHGLGRKQSESKQECTHHFLPGLLS